MSRDDNNFGGNPGRMNSGGFNSTAAGGYNGPSDRSGTNTAGYAMARGFAPPGAGSAGRDYNAARMGAIGGGANYYTGGVNSGPIPPARRNPANYPATVEPTAAPPPVGVSNPIPGYFDGVTPPNIQASYAWGLQGPWGKFAGPLGAGWQDRVGTNPKIGGPLGTGWNERIGYQPDRPGGKTGTPGNVGLNGRVY